MPLQIHVISDAEMGRVRRRISFQAARSGARGMRLECRRRPQGESVPPGDDEGGPAGEAQRKTLRPPHHRSPLPDSPAAPEPVDIRAPWTPLVLILVLQGSMRNLRGKSYF